MITKSMVKKGYMKNIIRLIIGPDNGVVGQIGTTWFYFGGETANLYDSVEKFVSDIPLETIIDEIYSTLEAFRIDGENGHEEFADEYLHDELFLREHGITETALDYLSAHAIYEDYYSYTDGKTDTLYTLRKGVGNPYAQGAVWYFQSDDSDGTQFLATFHSKDSLNGNAELKCVFGARLTDMQIIAEADRIVGLLVENVNASKP